MGLAYLARDAKTVLSVGQWLKAQQDASQTIVREYDNGIIYVSLTWVGKIRDYGDSFPEYYKLIRMDVFNYDSDGFKRPDPTKTEQWFPTEPKAVAAYEAFVTEWSDSYVSSEGSFVEDGNTLTPPPPPDPDAPTTSFNDPIAGDCAW